MKKAPTTVLDSLHHCWGLNWHKITVKKIQWCLMLGTLADDLSCPVQPPSLVATRYPVLYRSVSLLYELPQVRYPYRTVLYSSFAINAITRRNSVGTCTVTQLAAGLLGQRPVVADESFKYRTPSNWRLSLQQSHSLAPLSFVVRRRIAAEFVDMGCGQSRPSVCVTNPNT